MPNPRPRVGIIAALLLALTTDPAAAAEPPTSPGLSPRLMGIVIAGTERIAIFAGDPTLILREGDPIGDNRVVAIDARSVHLDGPSGPRRLTPGEDSTAREQHAATVPPPSIVDPYWRERETENDQ